MSGTSPSYSFTIRVKAENTPGKIGEITSTIGESGGDIGGIDIIRASSGNVIRDYTVNTLNVEHSHRIEEAIEALEGVEVVSISDRTFLIHLGGKISIENKVPLKTRDDLSMAYTPGVARVCMAIAKDKSKAYKLTIKQNTVAIVTDGSAVLGLGNIGPEAGAPVMEGKAMLFKKFSGLNAFPICLNTSDPDEIVETVERISPIFGGINLEDISAPRCFEIEERLQESLDIPVFHDDQHGTAIVVMAGVINSLKLLGKKFEDIKVAVCGTGAAGVACTKLLLSAGCRNIVCVDSAGVVYKGRGVRMNPAKNELAEITNPDNIKGTLADAIKGADIFLGVSSPNIVTVDMLKSMTPDPVVFALSNPTPEVDPQLAMPHVRIMASGRSDFQNQVNNVLCFPGFFKGLLQCQARGINHEMKIASARAIANVIKDDELSEDYIIPSVFDERVADRVAGAVIEEAFKSGLARKQPKV